MTRSRETKKVAFRLTMERFIELTESDGGFCWACGEVAYGIEPDARHYTCDSCGERQVFGAEELLVMGRVKFVAEGEEDDA